MYLRGKTNNKLKPSASSERPPEEVLQRQSMVLPFSRVQKIFPKLSAKALCCLVELNSFIPSDIIKLVPEASAGQVAKFLDLVEEIVSPEDVPRFPLEDKKEVSVTLEINKKNDVETASGNLFSDKGSNVPSNPQIEIPKSIPQESMSSFEISCKENEKPVLSYGKKRKLKDCEERISQSQPTFNHDHRNYLQDFKKQQALVRKHIKTIERQGKVIECQKLKLQKLGMQIAVLGDIVNNKY